MKILTTCYGLVLMLIGAFNAGGLNDWEGGAHWVFYGTALVLDFLIPLSWLVYLRDYKRGVKRHLTPQLALGPAWLFVLAMTIGLVGRLSFGGV
jgi:hypothetical protein